MFVIKTNFLSSNSSKILDYNATRYKEEFEEIIKLGKGGFGSVYKVKNVQITQMLRRYHRSC